MIMYYHSTSSVFTNLPSLHPLSFFNMTFILVLSEVYALHSIGASYGHVQPNTLIGTTRMYILYMAMSS